MRKKYRFNIQSLLKHFYVAIVSLLLISFALASWTNSAYYSTPNKHTILSTEVIRRFTPYLLLCIVTIAVLRSFERRFSQNRLPITLYLFLSISYLTIIIQLVGFSNQLPILTSFVNIKHDHCLSYVAATRPSAAPHRQFLLYFRARRFLSHSTLLVPSEHTADSRLATLCRANIRKVSYDSDISIEEAKKLVARDHIVLPAKGFDYILVPEGEADIPVYYIRKTNQIFFILPLLSTEALGSSAQ